MRSSLDYAGFAQLCGRSPIMREIMRAHNRIIPRSLVYWWDIQIFVPFPLKLHMHGRRLRVGIWLSDISCEWCARDRPYRNATRAVNGLVWPLDFTALGMYWTEGDTMKTTMSNIFNITFIERRHACWTELLKNGDGRTDGRAFSSPRPMIGDQPGEAAPLPLHDVDWLETH